MTTEEKITPDSAVNPSDKKARNRAKKKKDLFAPAAFVIKTVNDDMLVTNAAAISMFVLMSFIPLLMLLIRLLTRFQFSTTLFTDVISGIIPVEYEVILENITGRLYTQSLGTTAFSFVLIIALWASSTGISALVNGLNRVYKWQKRRNWFVHRALCLLYTIVFLAMLFVVLMTLVFGRRIQEYILLKIPAFAGFSVLFTLMRYIVTLVFLFLFFLCLYQLFPQNKLKFWKQIPGALTATAGWYVFSMIYSLYIRRSKNLPAMYGSLSLVIFFLMWLYVCMLIILIGGEVNYVWNNKYYYKLFLITRRKERVAREQRKYEHDWDEKPDEGRKKYRPGKR